MQIDEVNIIVVVVSGGNGSNRKITSLAAKTSKGLLLMFNIPGEIGTPVGWMNLATASEHSPFNFATLSEVKCFTADQPS